MTACPSDIDLACFVDGRLDAPAHQAVLSHLDACDDCRDVVATAIEALPPEAQAASEGQQVEPAPGEPPARSS